MQKIVDKITDKLIDEDLIKVDDYPSADACYTDVKGIIYSVLKDYIIIKGEILQ